jgi:hypothetical protein
MEITDPSATSITTYKVYSNIIQKTIEIYTSSTSICCGVAEWVTATKYYMTRMPDCNVGERVKNTETRQNMYM